MMSSEDKQHLTLSLLQKHLLSARAEINNLRKEIKTLKYLHSKEVDGIKTALNGWRCPSCQITTEIGNASNGAAGDQESHLIKLQPIGTISTGFIRKRAIPRQPNVNLNSHGKITLFNHVFTNPDHSLEGLEGFSHVWVLFHFHKNASNHIHAKVAPPRLGGVRVGVFGTRSPHRPCPLGLSLVHIDKIEGSSVYFSGVDMLDGSPVLDLKPYIPQYDDPAHLCLETVTADMERLELDGQESESAVDNGRPTITLVPPPPTPGPVQREAPDGEEEQGEAASPQMSRSPVPTHRRQVRVPEWVSQPSNSPLQVTFTAQARAVLSSLSSDEDLTNVITDILREDPRSVYLRDRHASQFYTFQIRDCHVSCKFDDFSRSVKVFKVSATGGLCQCGCGQPEWQCSATNDS